MNTFRGFTALAFAATLFGQTPPAPTADRVGFPNGYANWTRIYVFDRADNRQVRTVYANDIAASVKEGEQGSYPYGSVLVMEVRNALRDTQGNPLLDAAGRFQPDPAANPTLFTMRKEAGFGTAYGPNQTGEWEYVSYMPNGTFATAPQASFACAACHVQAGKNKDWVFRADLRYGGGDHQSTGALPGAVITNYTYLPGTLTVKAGAPVTIYNSDAVAHTIADDFTGGWTSPQLKPVNGSITLTFTTPGEFNYHCSIHPNMRGKIVVVPNDQSPSSLP